MPDPAPAESAGKSRGAACAAALSTPIGLTGFFFLFSYLLPELGSPVFLTLERRHPGAALAFLAFALWLDIELVLSQPNLRHLPRGKGGKLSAVKTLLWVIGHLIFLGLFAYVLSWVTLWPASILFALVTLLAKEATAQPVYAHRVGCDLLFLAALGLAVPGFYAVAQRMGWVGGSPWGSNRWTAFSALIAVGTLVVAIVALIGRINPLLLHRLFMPPVEG